MTRFQMYNNWPGEHTDNGSQPREFQAHVKARTERPTAYPERFPVSDDKVDWQTPFPEYRPTYFVDEKVLAQDSTKKADGWADPEDITTVRHSFVSAEGQIGIDTQGRPLNPRGRTGIEGRGLLGKWGPNYAADPIITRFNPQTGSLELLAIERRDTGAWAIPGGMVDRGETVTTTLSREFKEEAGIELDMDDATLVYRGYVDDPRNTDNAWMETEARHKHLVDELADKLEPKAGDDAINARWFTLTPDSIAKLYASHGELVTKAIELFTANQENDLSSLQREQLEELITMLKGL